MIDAPRTLVAVGLLGGYSLAAWLRYDRDAHLTAVAVLIGSLGLMAYGAWVRARLLRAARRASVRTASDPSVPTRVLSEADRIRELVEWNETQQSVGLESTIREGPLVNGIRRLPVLYFWVCTLFVLFVPARLLPPSPLPVPRFIVALALAAASALVLALLLGFFGWRSAKKRARAA